MPVATNIKKNFIFSFRFLYCGNQFIRILNGLKREKRYICLIFLNNPPIFLLFLCVKLKSTKDRNIHRVFQLFLSFFFFICLPFCVAFHNSKMHSFFLFIFVCRFVVFDIFDSTAWLVNIQVSNAAIFCVWSYTHDQRMCV